MSASAAAVESATSSDGIGAPKSITITHDHEFITVVVQGKAEFHLIGMNDCYFIKVQSKNNSNAFLETIVISADKVNKAENKCKNILRAKAEFLSWCVQGKANAAQAVVKVQLLGSNLDFGVQVKLGNEQFVMVGTFLENGLMKTRSVQISHGNDIDTLSWMRLLVALKTKVTIENKSAADSAAARIDAAAPAAAVRTDTERKGAGDAASAAAVPESVRPEDAAKSAPAPAPVAAPAASAAVAPAVAPTAAAGAPAAALVFSGQRVADDVSSLNSVLVAGPDDDAQALVRLRRSVELTNQS